MELAIMIFCSLTIGITIVGIMDVSKKNKELDEMVDSVRKRYCLKRKALTLDLTSKEALELIGEVVDIPNGYYIGVNSNNILEITLFKSNDDMPNKMGKKIETFCLKSYRANELISFGIELLNYINEKGFKNE